MNYSIPSRRINSIVGLCILKQMDYDAGWMQGEVVLTTCESTCLELWMYHRFSGEVGKGKVLVGEVNMINDDASDNCIYE